jgi:hypothetical protein
MGWVRVQMDGLDEPARSFRVLAKRLTASKHWPRSEDVEPESLAVYLGQLDKGRSEWFVQRSGVLDALADVLGMTLEELKARMGAPGEPRRRGLGPLTLWDIDTRPFDVRKERLPPGIPSRVLEPRSWPCWWHAPSGSGRTLAGLWLEAQGLAVYIVARTWQEAQEQLPARGAVFVELTHATGATDLPAEPPAYLSICIAADAPAPLEPRSDKLTFLPAQTKWPLAGLPPVESWVEELVRWVAQRLPPDEELDVEECVKWLREAPLALGLIDGFGAALGFVGLFVQFGGGGRGRGRRLLSQANELSGMANLFLRMRMQRAVQQGARVEANRDPLWNSLRRMARGLIQHGEQSWFSDRPLEEWFALAHAHPDTHALEWLEELVARKKLSLKAGELEQLQRELPPDAFRTVQQLRGLRLLHEVAPGRFAMRPLWFLGALLEEASTALFDEGAEVWGRALLQRHGTAILLKQFEARCQAGDFSPIERLLQSPAPASPFWVAALEASFRVLGLRLLMGFKVPPRLQAAVFREQQALVIELHGGPHPRIDYSIRSHSPDEPWLKRGMWLLAALTLSFSLGERLRDAHPGLDPWKKGASASLLHDVLSNIEMACLGREVDAPLRMMVYVMGGTLLEQLGPVFQYESRIHGLQAPEWLLREHRKGPLTWEVLSDLMWTHCFEVLPEYAHLRGVDWRELARAVWRAWLDSTAVTRQDFPQLFWLNAPWASPLWGEFPAEAVAVLATRYTSLLEKPELYPFFQEAHWDAFFSFWREETVRRQVVHDQDAPWTHVPVEHARRAIRQGVLGRYDHGPRQELWRRFPSVVSEEVGGLISQGRWVDALDFAGSPPEEQREAVFHHLEAGLSRPDVPRDFLVKLLHDRIGLGERDWPRAWALLQRLTSAPQSA